jgi:hypothetical protein
VSSFSVFLHVLGGAPMASGSTQRDIHHPDMGAGLRLVMAEAKKGRSLFVHHKTGLKTSEKLCLHHRAGD